MIQRIIKNNPAFLSEDELVRSFVVRHSDLDLILEILHENRSEANQHILVIGPRGSGKTMLVLRVAAAMRREDSLNTLWYPIVFSEESYRVSTPGEFWLEALSYLAHRTDAPRWHRTYEELSSAHISPSDDSLLQERALSQLMDFADSGKKRLLLIVENINMLFKDQLSSDDAWVLRHTLLNEPRIMLLATATCRFDEIENSGKALFELLKIQTLQPLIQQECQTLWQEVTGQQVSGARVRPILILTGGNPRLLAMVSSFGAKLSLKELMDDLMQLVDDHTEYFKSHLDDLPATERKVYLSLAEIWDPATARDVAAAARLDVSKTSALLQRLIARGAVAVIDEKGGRKWYQVAERMYNIYYLMRRRGGPSRRVRAVVNFMISFYGAEELVQAAHKIAEEACILSPDLRKDHYIAYEALLEQMPSEDLRNSILCETPAQFLEAPDAPQAVRDLLKYEAPTEVSVEGLSEGEGMVAGKSQLQVEQARILQDAMELEKTGKLEEAEVALRKAIDLDPTNSSAWAHFGVFLVQPLERYKEAEATLQKAVELDDANAGAWAGLGFLYQLDSRFKEAEQAFRKVIVLDENLAFAWEGLGLVLDLGLDRYEEAERTYRKALELNEKSAVIWGRLGCLLHEQFQRYEEAEDAFRKAVELDDTLAPAWAALARLYLEREQFTEAESAYRKAIEVNREAAYAWMGLGRLCELLGRYEEAVEAYRQVIKLKGEDAGPWERLGWVLHVHLEQYAEAESAYRKAIELDEQNAFAWGSLGLLLHHWLRRFEEAEAAYQRALELDEELVPAWFSLGSLLHVELAKFEEAETAYRKGLQIEPDDAPAWWLLGNLLEQHLGRCEEAENAYRKAIELKPDYATAWRSLIGLEKRHSLSTPALELAKRVVDQEKESPDVLITLARAFLESATTETLQLCERWTRDAIAQASENAFCYYTLALVLSSLGRVSEALEPTQEYLGAVDVVAENLAEATNLLIGVAAGGQTERAVAVLEESPSRDILEPLIVGLKMSLGEEVKAPAEIVEVGKDIVEQIKQLREKHEPPTS